MTYTESFWVKKLAESVTEFEINLRNMQQHGEEPTGKDLQNFINEKFYLFGAAVTATLNKHKNLVAAKEKSKDTIDFRVYIADPWGNNMVGIFVGAMMHAYIEQKTGKPIQLGTEPGCKGLQRFENIKKLWISHIGDFLNVVEPKSTIQNRMSAKAFVNDFMGELNKAIPDLNQFLGEKSRVAA